MFLLTQPRHRLRHDHIVPRCYLSDTRPFLVHRPLLARSLAAWVMCFAIYSLADAVRRGSVICLYSYREEERVSFPKSDPPPVCLLSATGLSDDAQSALVLRGLGLVVLLAKAPRPCVYAPVF